MRHFGDFLLTLRSSAGLSQEEVISLVDASRSTISRLENDEISRPFKGMIRRVVLSLAEILCTSRKETLLYLELASIDADTLLEAENVQLGFLPQIVQNSQEERADLERFEHLHQERLNSLETKEQLLGVNDAPPNLKLKIQEHTNRLKEIRKRLDVLSNREVPSEPVLAQTAHVYHTTSLEGRIIVGQQYEDISTFLPHSYDLYDLASENAQYLMQLAEVERFAVDDCILLTNSEDFQGWEAQNIKTTILANPLPIPDDLEIIRQEKVVTIEKHYFNSPHYRLVSATPAFSELDHLKVTLAPLGFYDYYSLNPYFDEPLLTALDGSKISIRQKYGNTALTYSSTDRGTSLIPSPVSVQCIVITNDDHIVLMQRSLSVAFYPTHWSASFEETMNASITDGKSKGQHSGDANFFATTIRGLNEEFAIPANAIEYMKVLSLNVEYLTLSIDVITLVKVNLSGKEIKRRWMLKAPHREEASKIVLLSTDLDAVIEKLFSKILWHPTSRMRLIQYLFHSYGIDAVEKALESHEK